MTLQLLVNGVDYTSSWRPFESRWSQKAWQGESVQSEFAIDDVTGAHGHSNFAARKIVEVWEDASGTPICMYRGRIANKQLGPGTFRVPGHAMRWTLQCEDYNIDLRGIRVENAVRNDETDDARVEAIRLAYLNGSASTHASARDSTDLDGNFIGTTPGNAVNMVAETYRDLTPADVLQQITEKTGRIFFVYLTDDGDGELVYISRPDEVISADITITDDAFDEGADGIDVYAAEWGPAGDHAGQDVLTGGAVRYLDGSYFTESDIPAGAEALHDKWETTVQNDTIRTEAVADDFLHHVVAQHDETNTYLATIWMRAEHAHRIRAGMMVPLIRHRANKPGDTKARAVVVTHEPVLLKDGQIPIYKVSVEIGRPQFTRSGPINRRQVPRPPTPSTPGTVNTGKLYYTQTDDGTSGVTGADYALTWDAADPDIVGPKRLRTTPQDTYANVGGGDIGFDGVGIPVETMVNGIFTFPLSDSAAVLAGVQNGGVWRTVIRSKNRWGAGVSETAQLNYPTGAIRVWRPGTSTFIGTILDVGAWQATARFDPGPAYPSIPMSATGAAVPSAVGTDYLVVDLGADHQAPTSGATGWDYRFSDQSDIGDLPFVVDSVADLNSWLDVSATSGGTAGPSDELTGDDVGCYALCNHKHHVVRERAPTPADDEVGYPTGTFWVQVDETSDPTEIIATYLSVDDTSGAAVWLLQSPLPSDPPASTTLTIAEEDTSPSGTFDTLTVPNDSLTDNGDGSASIAYLQPSHGERAVVNTVAASGSTETLDLADGNVHDVTLTANCTFTFSGALGGVECKFRLIMRQDGTGSRVPTFPGSVVWPDDTEPTWSTAADAVDIVEFSSIDGGTTWFGDAGGSAAAAGGGSSVPPGILLESGHSVPFTFDEILQTSDGSDFLWESE